MNLTLITFSCYDHDDDNTEINADLFSRWVTKLGEQLNKPSYPEYKEPTRSA